jgi:uncharacterized protein (DUF433 family)
MMAMTMPELAAEVERLRAENERLRAFAADASVLERVRIASLTARMTTVWMDPSRMAGQPCVRGTRIPVAQVLDMLAGGDSIEELSTAFRLERALLRDLLLELSREWAGG